MTFFTLLCSHRLTMQLNKLQLTNSSVHSPLLFFFVFPDIFTPFSKPVIYWNVWAYNPINKAPLSALHLFSPLIFASLASVLSLRRSVSPSLSLGWPPWTFPHHTRLREIKIDTKYNAAVAFTQNEVPDGVIKGLDQAATLTACWTRILPLRCNMFPFVLFLAPFFFFSK